MVNHTQPQKHLIFLRGLQYNYNKRAFALLLFVTCQWLLVLYARYVPPL